MDGLEKGDPPPITSVPSFPLPFCHVRAVPHECPLPCGSSVSSVRQKKSSITHVALSVCDHDSAKGATTSARHKDGAVAMIKTGRGSQSSG